VYARERARKLELESEKLGDRASECVYVCMCEYLKFTHVFHSNTRACVENTWRVHGSTPKP